MDRPTPPTTDAQAPAGRAPAALAGLAAAAAALGAGELVAGIFDKAPSLVIGVGDALVDVLPGWVDRAAIDTFGTSDKDALILGTILLAALFGAGLGILARRHLRVAASGYVAFAVIGVVATISQPGTSAVGACVVGAIGALCGVIVLHALVDLATRPRASAPTTSGLDRRTFLISAGGTLVVGALAGMGGWVLSGRERVDEMRRTIRLPRPFRRAAAAPAGADLDIPGLTPLFVPNDDFYRIDTALRPPAVDPSNWKLAVRGRVDHPYSLTYRELMSLPQIEADITLACVSNEVGGNLVGNARWQGVPLSHLLDRAGAHESGEQLLGHSVDGFTAGFPTTRALSEPNAMVAVAMNGRPLPIEHGFPARLLVPGLYGYVSATKWLTEIELTGWERDGYWIPRGWSKKGPIKTQSRIDVPRPGSSISARPTAIAGVAWAPTRGIQGVQVKVDDGPWREATLADALNVDCWRQWHLRWHPTPGSHTITARATDGTGHTQTAEVTAVAPNGASGYPSIQVTATA